MRLYRVQGICDIAVALIVLTQLDGAPIFIESDQVAIIKGSSARDTYCKSGHGSVVNISGRGLCVKESPKEICDKIEKFGGKCEDLQR